MTREVLGLIPADANLLQRNYSSVIVTLLGEIIENLVKNMFELKNFH